ncbi:hypothetical protein RclHR1_03200002 [Rhizophagus clarus]|uniref:Uncharacterized protein n=1 Tax=Rhizophagus clarus TaxID=94130 RepID=A0A2Z6RBH8_9GLOM|nr:hypothetical protein RclHR1_03200002 [Rhizophagus clarus]GES97317.1 hypothetical protein GLOIN_2v1732727 [Rhizophagus clarus]
MENESVNTGDELQDRNEYFKNENANLKMKLKEYEKITESLKAETESLKAETESLKAEIQSLKQKNDDLEAEASRYQSALGIATNFDYSDDQNLNVKLNEDILSLHDTLEIYVTNLKPKIDVNVDNAKQLLRKFNCQTDKEPEKPLIKAALQRHVLEEILDKAESYFKCSNNEYFLESDIVESATNLTGLMERLYHNRLGDDEITRLIPIRLRQQIYIALGTRGFNDIKESISKYNQHKFINVISKKLNEMMDKFREIRDIEKKKYVNGLAKGLVRDVVRIFYFRLPTQEPVAKYHWFNNNEKINRITMKSSWDEDEIDDLVVAVCSFPMIYKPDNDGDKICTPAKVSTRHFIEKNLLEECKDVISTFAKTIIPDDYSALSLQVNENEFF